MIIEKENISTSSPNHDSVSQGSTSNLDNISSRKWGYNESQNIISLGVYTSGNLILDGSYGHLYEIEPEYSNYTCTVSLYYGNAETTYDYFPNAFHSKAVFNKQVFIKEFEYKILEFQERNEIEEALDYVFNTIDDKLILDEFELCNSLLDNLKIGDIRVDILIGILTITLSWKHTLPSRNTFFLKVKSLILKIYSIEEAESILIGLE